MGIDFIGSNFMGCDSVDIDFADIDFLDIERAGIAPPGITLVQSMAKGYSRALRLSIRSRRCSLCQTSQPDAQAANRTVTIA